MPKPQVSNPDRVRLWNSLLHQARAEARNLANNRAPDGGFEPRGGRLSNEQQSILTLLALCTLSIEARANHLIIELVERGKLSADQGRSAQRLPPLDKWLLLPSLAGRRTKIATDKAPHQAVAEICRRRNGLMHINFQKLRSSDMPSKTKMLALFRGFVEAMEDMNVMLRRVRAPRKRVLRLGLP